MAVVTQRTGLTSHAIRAWERRFGVVEPARSEGGHRLYSDQDVARLSLLHRLTLGGRQIGQVAGMSDAELEALLREDESAEAAAPSAGTGKQPDEIAAMVAEAQAAVRELNADKLDAVLRRAVIGLETAAYLDQLIVPLLRGIGAAWVHGELTPAHEHMASAVVGRVGGWLLENLEARKDAPVLIAAAPSGDRHELGSLAAAILAASAGWRVTFLGADLPADFIAGAAVDTRARGVAISLTYPQGDPGIIKELQDLRRSLPQGLPIVAGGGAADSYADVLDAIGARRADSFRELKSYLDNWSAQPAAS
jgi:DNA-binding transcriptional MerR regulator/methylmalonyl-CoA mutase cobalamin-binding subunit